MQNEIILLILILLFLYSVFKPQKGQIIKTKCIKQPDKDCTYQMKFTDRGVHCSGHFDCCKIIDQMKAMNEIHCNAIPGKNYNGVIITQEFKDKCLENRHIIMKIDSSGPQKRFEKNNDK